MTMLTATIETDSGNDIHLSGKDANALATAVLLKCEGFKDAICAWSDSHKVNEAMARQLIDRCGYEIEDSKFCIGGFGGKFSDRLAEDLRELVNESDAARDILEDDLVHGCSDEDHRADQRAMIMIGVV